MSNLDVLKVTIFYELIKLKRFNDLVFSIVKKDKHLTVMLNIPLYHDICNFLILIVVDYSASCCYEFTVVINCIVLF